MGDLEPGLSESLITDELAGRLESLERPTPVTWTILLFARMNVGEASWFLGPATYVCHERERPMAFTWKLERPLPGDLYQEFAAAVV